MSLIWGRTLNFSQLQNALWHSPLKSFLWKWWWNLLECRRPTACLCVRTTYLQFVYDSCSFAQQFSLSRGYTLTRGLQRFFFFIFSSFARLFFSYSLRAQNVFLQSNTLSDFTLESNSNKKFLSDETLSLYCVKLCNSVVHSIELNSRFILFIYLFSLSLSFNFKFHYQITTDQIAIAIRMKWITEICKFHWLLLRLRSMSKSVYQFWHLETDWTFILTVYSTLLALFSLTCTHTHAPSVQIYKCQWREITCTSVKQIQTHSKHERIVHSNTTR